MQKHKRVAHILDVNGITGLTLMQQCRIISGTTEGNVYFYDVEGDYVWANSGTTSPTIVDSYTTSIYFKPMTYALGSLINNSTGITILNQNGDNVTFECTLTVTNNTTSGVTLGTQGGTSVTVTSISGKTFSGTTNTSVVTVAHPDITGTTGATFTIYPLTNYAITSILTTPSAITNITGVTATYNIVSRDQNGLLLGSGLTDTYITSHDPSSFHSTGITASFSRLTISNAITGTSYFTFIATPYAAASVSGTTNITITG